MKLKFIFFGLFLVFYSILRAQTEFITIWKPSNVGFLPTTSTSTQIYFPGIGTNYKIYWEEVGYPTHHATLNNVATVINVPLLIDFGASLNPVANDATYTLKVSQENGNFNRIYFNLPTTGNRGDSHKIIKVTQWGDIQWSSMERAFFYCTEMDVTATDIPILDNVTNMSGMFSGCYELIGNPTFSNWNLSGVTNLSQCFYFAKKFNQPISTWDISDATDISDMFVYAELFNQPIGVWNTSKVTNMAGILQNTVVFNQSLANWDTSKVTDMSAMFLDAGSFNQPIGNWNTSKVENMEFMFSGSPMFNQPINNWDTSNVNNMQYIFQETGQFNQPIDNWNTGKVTNMAGMFSESQMFNQPIDNWNTAKVTNMAGMFSQSQMFNQPIGNWDTSKVTDMRWMFNDAAAFNQNLGSWNLSSAPLMNLMLDLSALSCINYDSTLVGWANNPITPSSLTLGSAGLVYSSPQAVNARNTLTNLKGWTIINDIYNAECNLSTSEVHKANLKIYPNPVKNTLFFSSELHKIEIYSIDGKLLKRNPIGNHIDIPELSKGVYILKATDHLGKLLSEKIIKD